MNYRTDLNRLRTEITSANCSRCSAPPKKTRAVRFWCLVALFTFPAACSTVPQHSIPVSESEDSAIEEPRQVSSTGADIEKLLRDADLALREHRLTTPDDDNAWYRYLRVLALEPGNQRARQGIHDIVEQYLDWALDQVERGNLRKAKDYLSKASGIDELHPNIRAIAKRIHELENSEKKVIELAMAEVNSRSPALATRLSKIGADIPRSTAQVIIYARNDSEGRWIYQHLAASEQQVRLRAQILFADQPSITIIFNQQ